MSTWPKTIIIYEDTVGHVPFFDWLHKLRDKKAVATIDIRIERVKLGNLGYWSSVGEGVGELKIDFGPGYRVYFGQIGLTFVVLLCGGDKATQSKDIIKAKKFWHDFKERYYAKEK